VCALFQLHEKKAKIRQNHCYRLELLLTAQQAKTGLRPQFRFSVHVYCLPIDKVIISLDTLFDADQDNTMPGSS